MKLILLFKIYLNVSLNNKFLNLHLTVIHYSLNLIKSTIIYIEILVEFYNGDDKIGRGISILIKLT
jgi:hypothetical protein